MGSDRPLSSRIYTGNGIKTGGAVTARQPIEAAKQLGAEDREHTGVRERALLKDSVWRDREIKGQTERERDGTQT